jgi:hypothetical protein
VEIAASYGAETSPWFVASTVLLALVRSELGSELLERVSDLLVADRGGLLRELIRTIMAVDVEPATKLFAAAGIDAAFIPPSLHIPNKPSWHRLIKWSLAHHYHLPANDIPDIVTSTSRGRLA